MSQGDEEDLENHDGTDGSGDRGGGGDPEGFGGAEETEGLQTRAEALLGPNLGTEALSVLDLGTRALSGWTREREHSLGQT